MNREINFSCVASQFRGYCPRIEVYVTMGCANTKKASVVEKKESEPKPECEASKEEGVKEVDLTAEVTNDDAEKNATKSEDAPTTSE